MSENQFGYEGKTYVTIDEPPDIGSNPSVIWWMAERAIVEEGTFQFHDHLYIAVKGNRNKCDDCDFQNDSREEILGCAKSPPCSSDEREDGFEIIWKLYLTKEKLQMLEKQIERIADSLEKLVDALSGVEALNGISEKADTKKADTKKADTKKADTKKADTKKADTKKVDTKKVDTKKTDDEVPSLDDVVKALQAYMKAEGRDAAIEMLGKYDAKRASDIPEENRADFIADTTVDGLTS